MMRRIAKLQAYWALGPANLARVLHYRIRVRCGLFPNQPIDNPVLPPGCFFGPVGAAPTGLPIPRQWLDEGLLFSFHSLALGEKPPNWLEDPLTHRQFPNPDRAWFKISDFDSAFGDIKLVWELSRFSWILSMAQRAREGSVADLERINGWLDDWCIHNPPWRGPNWKCAQEAGIRVIHLAAAALLLGELKPTSRLQQWLEWHLTRIAPTMPYARAQDNNHGTSEAAALFIGGAWLASAGHSKAVQWMRQGRRALEERVANLVADDGSFSQHSLTYHRMVLDTLSIAELWKRAHDLPNFSDIFARRAQLAANWMQTMIFGVDGDGPNLGANDGAQLLPMSDIGYRDFRPSCALATSLFSGSLPFDGKAAEICAWFDALAPVTDPKRSGAELFDKGGYAVLRHGRATALLRYPRFRFRPSQCDVQHVDIWLDGLPLFSDGGTYSYNDGDNWIHYFGGITGHNSIVFDGREPMPRIGRFLLGDWLHARDVAAESSATGSLATAAYRDRYGASHRRTVELHDGGAIVRDTIDGFLKSATMRWRLPPGNWVIDGDRVSNGKVEILISGLGLSPLRLESGYSSLYYKQLQPVPVLAVDISAPSDVETHMEWSL